MDACGVDLYARAIDTGTEPAGKYHRLACRRHLRDRERERTDPTWPFVFDERLADRFFRFAEQLRHYKGEWARQRILLQPYQRFRLGSTFGWIHRATGLRRFRTSYNELPRKNGKSLEAGIVALYASFFDDEAGAEGYCLATKRDQAKIVFNDARQLVEGSRGLSDRIAVLALALSRIDRAQKLVPLGADSDSTDGLNPHLIIVDEFHAHKDRGLLDVMETATGARRQPLNFQITTAGDDPLSPCGDQHDYACKILDRVLDDETFFAFIAHADKEDGDGEHWLDERVWRKANPNYGVSVKPDDLRALATKARYMPAAAAAFKQKRLNLWVHTLTPWLSLEGWRKGQTALAYAEAAAQLEGEVCYIGVDLSSKIDLSAVAYLFPPTETRRTWRVLVRCLTPADTLPARALRDRAPYQTWVEQGWLDTNAGNRIDQTLLTDWIIEAGQHYTVQQIGIDPWNAGTTVTTLQAEGFDVIEVPQNTSQLSAPAKDFEADVLDGLVDAGGNPLMQWCVSNAVVQRDKSDNIFPVKNKSRGRIDPVVATVIARKLAMLPADEADDPDVIVA